MSKTGKHAAQPYNPDVANAFFRSGMIEAWGRGIEWMMKDCLNAGVLVPNLRYKQTGLWVEFSFSDHSGKQKMQKLPKKLPKKKSLILSKHSHSLHVEN